MSHEAKNSWILHQFAVHYLLVHNVSNGQLYMQLLVMSTYTHCEGHVYTVVLLLPLEAHSLVLEGAA